MVEVDRRENELLLFGSRKDFVKIYGDAKGYQEESSDPGANPVWWL